MSAIEFPYDVTNAKLRERFISDLLPKAIDSLDADTDPSWGRMSAQHMVEHLMFSFRMSTGDLEVECKTPEEKLGKMQAFLSLNRPMPKGFVNPVTGEKLVELQFQNMASAKKALEQSIQHFQAYYKAHPDAREMSPMFGELGAEGWQKFHFKHCFHHLSQFGLVEEE